MLGKPKSGLEVYADNTEDCDLKSKLITYAPVRTVYGHAGQRNT